MSHICGNTGFRQEMPCVNCDCEPSSTPPANVDANLSLERLGPRALLLCRTRNWSTQWDSRMAQMLLEMAELTEAIRGKRGNPVQEAGDVLLVLASLLEANNVPMQSALEEAHRKIDALMDAPRYPGEHFATACTCFTEEQRRLCKQKAACVKVEAQTNQEP